MDLKLPIEEFTTPNPVTAGEDEVLDNLNHLMKENGIRHIPILKNGKVVGVISDRDLKVASGLSRSEKELVLAADIMSMNPVTVSAGSTLEEVAFEMSKSKIGCVIVNDENDQLLGIFTVTDALNALIEIARGDQ